MRQEEERWAVATRVVPRRVARGSAAGPAARALRAGAWKGRSRAVAERWVSPAVVRSAPAAREREPAVSHLAAAGMRLGQDQMRKSPVLAPPGRVIEPLPER